MPLILKLVRLALDLSLRDILTRSSECPRVDEPPPESSLSVAGQPGAIYSAGALQLDTKIAVWSENHPHNLAPSMGKKEE